MSNQQNSKIVDPVESAKFGTWPVYGQDEIDAVTKALASGRVNYWTGQAGRQFESGFAKYIGVNYGIAVSNGSLALGASLRALQLPAGSEVIVTPRTFIASISEIVLAGAIPVFADVDLESQNISANTIEPLISKRTSAIMAVHLAGWPCNMSDIEQLSTSHAIPVIEDCAQAHGATIAGRKVGAWGDIAAFSFCQDKIMSTCGEGGMITTNNPDLWERCWSFKDHGKNPNLLQRANTANTFQWVHEQIGTNARMTEPQAAVGSRQLLKLDGWLRQRSANAERLTRLLKHVSAIRTTLPGDDIKHAWYKYYCFVRTEALKDGWSRDRILAELANLGIPCGSGICPEVYLEAAFSDISALAKTRLPNAKVLGETSIMLPVHPTLNADDMDRIAESVAAVVSSATR